MSLSLLASAGHRLTATTSPLAAVWANHFTYALCEAPVWVFQTMWIMLKANYEWITACSTTDPSDLIDSWGYLQKFKIEGGFKKLKTAIAVYLILPLLSLPLLHD